MLLDGRAMMMDVAARQVTGELADASNAIASVDAAVLVADESEHAGSALPWPSAALPRNVIEQLTAAHDQREAARGPRMSGDRSI
jgi:predicted ATPase